VAGQGVKRVVADRSQRELSMVTLIDQIVADTLS
jgi:hypothetical protein